MRLALLATLISAPVGAAAQRPASDTLPLRVAELQIEAYNRGDVDGMMILFAESATMTEFPSGNLIARDKATIRDRFARSTTRPDRPIITVDSRVASGPFVFELERWKANPGERDHAIWMYEIRGGLIRRAWTVRMP